ncbi:MAG TPA: ATP-binding protein [Desulfobacteria bacterium]|nr:ATP-binding protein [Desulfobacteria bacterium]
MMKSLPKSTIPSKIRLSRTYGNELSRRIKEAEILNLVARETNLRRSLEQVLLSIAPQLRQLIPLNRCHLVRLKANSITCNPVCADCQIHLASCQQIVLDAIRDNRLVYVQSRCQHTQLSAYQVIIPVIRNDQVFGALLICNDKLCNYSPSQERFLLQFRDQIAVSMENLQLYDEVLQAEIEKLSLVGELAAGAAHEIRNPLTAIRGFVQIFQTSETGNSLNGEYFSIILEEIDRIEQIVRELLLLAKPLKHKWVKRSISELLSSLNMLIESQAHLNDILVEMKFAPNLPEVYMDPDQLKQVFLNLIQNAIEAMPTGGKLSINAKQSYGFIVVEIKDTGTGIPPESLDKIFHPFYTTKESTKGTGLGLSISSRIVQSFGGTLKVKSKLGSGTVFTVRLPHA